VTPEIKFCGLTRSVDAQFAAELGAGYVGVIFAGGPRQRTVEEAAAVLADLPRRVKRVGVFGAQAPDEIASVVSRTTRSSSIARIRRGTGAVPPGGISGSG